MDCLTFFRRTPEKSIDELTEEELQRKYIECCGKKSHLSLEAWKQLCRIMNIDVEQMKQQNLINSADDVYHGRAINIYNNFKKDVYIENFNMLMHNLGSQYVITETDFHELNELVTNNFPLAMCLFLGINCFEGYEDFENDLKLAVEEIDNTVKIALSICTPENTKTGKFAMSMTHYTDYKILNGPWLKEFMLSMANFIASKYITLNTISSVHITHNYITVKEQEGGLVITVTLYTATTASTASTSN